MTAFSSTLSTNSHLKLPTSVSAPSIQDAQGSQDRDNAEDLLPSDLELSFASAMELNSPIRRPAQLTGTAGREDVVPMDISPEPSRFVYQPRIAGSHLLEKVTRTRAFTSSARLSERNFSNETPASPVTSSCRGTLANHSQQEPSSPDAMDVDNSFVGSPAFPPNASKLHSIDFDAAPGSKDLENLFYDPSSPIASRGDHVIQPNGSRRSISPEACPEAQKGRRRAGTISVFDGSSPLADSSPSALKLERLANCTKKPTLNGLGMPSDNPTKRRPYLSSMVLPSDTSQFSQPPVVSHGKASALVLQEQSMELPPPRRAFSAMLPQLGPAMQHSGESSAEHEGESSPALAYAKRQQIRTIRRRDGTDDFRSFRGATAMIARDKESPRARMVPECDTGLGGFGDHEAHGKILPCHRVRDDGLMRISCKTLNNLLDGTFNSQLTSYQVIDCRFDYEYNGGHVPGAVNINTTVQLEEYFFSAAANKPVPSVSGDGKPKRVLIFHCEFSAKRAPTFAKHLRSKDRAVNGHNYPRVHFPEVYVLEGGYRQYFKESSARCEPPGYIRMDDPNHAASRKEDLDHFRKVKFGRTKSYAYGDAIGHRGSKPQKHNAHNTTQLTRFHSSTSTTRSHCGTNDSGLGVVPEDCHILPSEDEETDVGDSPCPPPSRNTGLKTKNLGRRA